MTSKRLAVTKKNGQFVAGIFTESGLYATSLPRPSEKSAIAAVTKEKITRSDSPSHLEVLEIVFSSSNGEQIDLDKITFDFSGITEKQVKVLKATMEIPRGSTLTYGQLGKNAGLENAARFVGNVMASNRFAPLIPCHRVVASNGLGGYGYGLAKKKSLLKAERGFAD